MNAPSQTCFGRTLAVLLLACATTAIAAESRDTLTASADYGHQEVRPAAGTGAATARGNFMVDLEYARRLWSTFELTFAGNLRRVAQDTGAGESDRLLTAVQAGFRYYVREPGRSAWTPFFEASVGEAWLQKKTAGTITRQEFQGYDLGGGVAFRLQPDLDLRVSAVFEDYSAKGDTSTDQDILTRLGLRIGAAFRF